MYIYFSIGQRFQAEVFQIPQHRKALFVGANSIEEDYQEDKFLTQRFRIYDYVMGMFLSPQKFFRIYRNQNSAVLMINLQNKNFDKLVSDTTEMFIRIYSDLES